MTTDGLTMTCTQKTIQRHTHAGLRVNSGLLQAVTDETNEVNVKCFPSKVQFGLVDLAQCSPHPATETFVFFNI